MMLTTTRFGHNISSRDPVFRIQSIDCVYNYTLKNFIYLFIF